MKVALLVSVLVHALTFLVVGPGRELVWSPAAGDGIYYVSAVKGKTNAQGLPRGYAPRNDGKVATNKGSIGLKDVVQWGNVEPGYPEEAIRNGWEGETTLKLTLKEGQVTEALVDKSSGYRALDEAARNAALKWKLPADVGNQATIPILFKLD